MCAEQRANYVSGVVSPVMRPEVRELCRRPYPGHPKGCPNYGTRSTCPPRAPLLGGLFDLSKPVICVATCFDLGAHVDRMRQEHPGWSERQLRNCRYWQGTARKRLRRRIGEALRRHPGTFPCACPEACGVDVTATMRLLGVQLEWPPVRSTWQVALIGHPSSPRSSAV